MPHKTRPVKLGNAAEKTGTITWILLDSAISLIADAYQMVRATSPFLWRGGPDPAENMLYSAVDAGEVRIRYVGFGGKRWTPDGEVEPWIDDLPPLAEAWQSARINTRKSSAYLEIPGRGFGTFYRLEVAREDVVSKLLPQEYEAPAQFKVEAVSAGTQRGRKPAAELDVIRALCDIYFYEKGVPENISPLVNRLLEAWSERFPKKPPPEFRTMHGYVTRWAVAWRETEPTK